MRSLPFFVVCCLLLTQINSALAASTRRSSRVASDSGSSQEDPVPNPIFSFTHMLPSPLTISSGRLALGTDVAYGVMDSVQIGTGLLSDIYQVYNANLKINLVNMSSFSIAATGSVESYNYHDLDSSNPDLRVLSWRPGLVTGVALLPDVAAFFGGNLNYSKQTLITDGIRTSGYLQGAEAESDIAWAYNHGKRGIQNALAAGATYDFTYKIYGIGLTHYWHNFRIGAHYYPNADKYKLVPMIAGGAVVDF